MDIERNRFGTKSDIDIDGEIAENVPWNTKKSKASVWRQFTTFLDEKRFTIQEFTTSEELNEILKSWAFNMRKKDGSEYKEAVIKHMWNTTAKLLQEMFFNKWHKTVNPFSDIVFMSARNARDAARKKVQSCPEKRTSNAATFKEAEFLDMVRILDEKTPDGLQKKFFMIASYELAWRGGEGGKCLTNYFSQEVDNKGNPTGRIEYNPVFSKTAQGGAKPLSDSKWLIENKNKSDMCPVRLVTI